MKAAVLGHPIAHSLSPVLHNAAYAALGLGDWKYEAIDVEAGKLADFLSTKLLDSNEWAGFSLTMPLKKHVIAWLHDVARTNLAAISIDPLAAATGAANTLVQAPLPVERSRELFYDANPSVEELPLGSVRSALHSLLSVDSEQARVSIRAASASKPRILSAYNTDVYGIVAAIREVIRHGPVESIAILGAGATAASALTAAQQLGTEEVTVFARPSKSVPELRKVISEHFRPRSKAELCDRPNFQAQVEVVETNNIPVNSLTDFDAVISTLPAHATDDLAMRLAESGISGGLGALLDVVYDPRPTDLLATWSAMGGAIVGGERMLLHQAAKQVELMTGHPAPLAEMASALTKALD